MDTRVLAAVFITLLAIAVGMGQGTLDTAELRDRLKGFDGSPDLTALLGETGAAAPNTSVTGTVTTDTAITLKASSPARIRIGIDDATNVSVADATLQPSTSADLVVTGFTGEVQVRPGNATVTGSATGVSTQALELNYDTAKEFHVSTAPDLSIAGLQGQDLSFANATGTVTAGSTTVEVSRGQVWMQGFEGNLSVAGSTYGFSGAVRSAVVGGAEIG